MEYSGPAPEAFATACAALGVDASASGSRIRLTGEPPVLESPHRIALSGALALGIQGAAVASLWEARGGRAQDVRVETKDAVFALNPFPWLRRNGHIAHHLSQMFAPCAGYHATRDGRTLYITATYPKLRDGTLRLLDCPNDTDAVKAAVRRRDGEALEQAFIAAGLVGALVRTREEWLAHPQGRAVARQPLVQIERIGDAPPVPLGRAPRPLDGIRVADLTHVFAGPSLTRGLAEQGADVLHLGPIQPNLVDAIGITLETGIGKRSAILDFSEGDGPVLERLLSEADVFVQSWRPGQLDARGFSPNRLAQLRPGIVCVSVSCYGHEGPWASRGGFDPLALASTGITHDEALRDTHKISPPGIVTDGLAGFLGAAAVIATLGRRAREGGSWHIRLSLARMATWIQELGLLPYGTRPDTNLGDPRTMRMETPFGTLDHVAPAIRYEETPAFFDKPPVPVGASRAEWLPRNP